MATFLGNAGLVEVGGTAITEILSFSVTETGDTVEDTSMGDSWRTFKHTLKSWEATIEVRWDDTDAIQESLIPGASISVEFLPEGTDLGDYSKLGTALVSSVGQVSENEGIISRSISLQGTGALVTGTH